MGTVLDWGERGTRDGGGGKGAAQGGKLWGKSVLTGRGTRGCGEVCERVGVQEVAVGGVEGDYIVRGGEGIEGLREWIQLGRVLGGGGGGWGGRAVDGDDLALSGLGARPGPAGSRVLEEGRDKKRLERLPPLAHHVWQRRLERQPGGGQWRRMQMANLRKTGEVPGTPRT